MLILTRQIGESLVIGDLSLSVSGVFNKKVSLGIYDQKGKSKFSTINGELEEEIIINNDVKIKILWIRGKQVRLGIKAPPGIPILRDKLVVK